MNEEAAFLRAMAEAPDDLTLRLVFADWLEERGDTARSSLLRLKPIRCLLELLASYRNEDETSKVAIAFPKEMDALIQQPITVEHLQKFHLLLHEVAVVSVEIVNYHYVIRLTWEHMCFRPDGVKIRDEIFGELEAVWKWLIDNFGQEWKINKKIFDAFSAIHNNPVAWGGSLLEGLKKLSEPKTPLEK